jgi:hypothetical protein
VHTGYYAALGNDWTGGNTALQRRYLVQAAQEQEADGTMPAYAPRHSSDFMIILDSNTLWLKKPGRIHSIRLTGRCGMRAICATTLF